MKIVNYWEGEHPRKRYPWCQKSPDPLDCWVDVYPEWEHVIYTRQMATEFIHDNYGSDVVKLFDSFQDMFAAARADFFRVAYCLTNGGLYIDRRMVPRKRSEQFIDLLNKHSDLLLAVRDSKRVWNGFIHCTPGNQIIGEIWDNILNNVTHKLCAGNVWAATGPGVFNKVVDLKQANTFTIDFDHLMKFVRPCIGRDDNHWSVQQKSRDIYKKGGD